MVRVYFDVGANDGISMAKYIHEKDSVIFAFEPTPEMVSVLKDRYSAFSNYYIIQKAVSEIDGKATFYVSGNADWGCSSLCNFQQSDTLERTWPGRTDFKVTNKIEVDTIRLETFIDQKRNEGFEINQIEFFHCDVQGKDLEALMSMGKYLHIIKEGVIEMPTSHDTKLYTDQKWLVDDAIRFLERNGFEIINVISNDAQRNEVNVHFKNLHL